VRRRLMAPARLVSASLAVILLALWSAPPVAAAPAQAKTSQAPLSKSVAAKLSTLKPAARAFQANTATSGGSDRSFVRSPLGIIAIVAMAAGLGYAVHSAFKDNDPVHSPIR
jgi:hypothetical protein